MEGQQVSLNSGGTFASLAGFLVVRVTDPEDCMKALGTGQKLGGRGERRRSCLLFCLQVNVPNYTSLLLFSSSM